MKLLSILCEMIPVVIFIVAYCILFLLLKDEPDMDTQKEKK
jgi:hypothetical protein